MPESTRKQTVEKLRKFNHESGKLARFIILSYSYISKERDYGIEEKLTVIETAILLSIANNNGITATELAELWRKTKSAISHMLRSLDEKHLIERVRNDKNYKVQYLYLTEKGKKVVKNYQELDNEESPMILEEMLMKLSEEQIRNFYEVVDVYTDILMKIL